MVGQRKNYAKMDWKESFGDSEGLQNDPGSKSKDPEQQY